MTVWKLRCTICKTEWILKVSYNISDFKRIYHYCKVCKRNTYHEIIGKVEDSEETAASEKHE
ncbi:MAG: hypothetical protein DRO14_01240 [Thermoprotei archaeon]|nr:MAG: hypothetical protein DRO14_01240 [Thermoprotei archaeon]